MYNTKIMGFALAACWKRGNSMVKRVQIMPGVFFQGEQTKRFKTACFSLSLIRPLCREEAAMNALLPAVLLRGTRRYPDIQSISGFLDELYGASVSTLVRKNGEIQTTGFYASFMEDRFAKSGDQVMAPMIGFVRELLLDPLLVDGKFPEEFVEGEKWNLVNAIESNLNDKRAYASQRMLRLLCGEEGYGVPRLGTVEDVEAITSESLYAHYRNILRASRVEIFYCGSAEADQVAALVTRAFAGLGTENPTPVRMAAFRPGQEVRYEEETMDVAQGKLSMGFSTGCTARDPGFPAMMVLNACYGAGITSKLFMNVREKLSLCYYASSVIHGSKGLMTVSSGIDSANYGRAKEEILAQLEDCRRGKITQEELDSGKKAIISSLDTIQDSPGQMEDYSVFRLLSGQPLDIPDYRAAVERVTVRDVAEAARRIRLEAIFFLKGEQK